MWIVVTAARADTWPEVTLTAPASPRTIGWADVDGDGDLDHVAAASDRFVVYDGEPGGFGPARTLVRTGASAVDGAFVDVTGDGREDVIGEGRVYAADATAVGFTYVATMDPDVSPAVYPDRTGDGLRDVVGLRWGRGDDLAQLVNLGGGVFDAATSLGAVANATGALTEVDLDGDGRLDLLQTSISAGPTWYRDQRGTYRAGVVLVPGVYDALPVDWDGDGDVDLAYAASGRISVAANRGDGTFDPGAAVLTSALALAAVGEVDGDGRPDVVLSGSSGLSVALQGSRGTLGTPTDLGARRGRAVFVALQDVDADGDGELFVTDSDGHALFDEGAAGWTVTALSGPSRGRNDHAVLVDQPAGPPSLLGVPSGTFAINDGAGGFAEGPAIDLRVEPAAIGAVVAAVDVDGDGLRDLVSASQTRGDADLVWLPNVGGTPGAHQPLVAVVPHDVRAMIPGDADGDGDEDLLVDQRWTTNYGYVSHVSLSWLILPELTSVPVFVRDNAFLEGVEVADLDGDGAADLMVSAYATAEVWRNDGGGTHTRQADVDTGVSAVLDVDGDGLPDLLHTSAYGVGWRRGTAPFTWDPEVLFTPAGHRFAGAADVDLDGDLDLFVADPEHEAAWWENRSGTFVGAPALGTLWGDVSFADLDGNGTPDPYAGVGPDLVWWPNPVPPPEPAETGDTGLPPEDTAQPPPEDTGTTPTGTDDPDPDPDPQGGGEDGKGCGCASPSRSPVSGAGALLAWALARRRVARSAAAARGRATGGSVPPRGPRLDTQR